MRSFVLQLNSTHRSERIDGVQCFVGEDASGSFGLMAGHERFITALVFGLARYRRSGEPWQYLALPGGLVYFVDGQLSVGTRHYLRDADYARVSRTLAEQFLTEEAALESVKENLRRLEENMLKLMLELDRAR
jgi:F-type H+-transporting ATPase subunit epsilon